MSENKEVDEGHWYDGVLKKFKRSKRIEDSWSRMHKVGGFVNLFNIDDTEARRIELKKDLEDMKNKPPEERNLAIRNLFFSMGGPWVRGLDDRRISPKGQAFLELGNILRGLDAFAYDAEMCGLQMIQVSWKGDDVTNTPPYLIETHTVVNPESKRHKIGEEIEEH